jgi:prephenate dehydrogenase
LNSEGEHSLAGLDVAIVGLGLMGGSIARDLAARGARVLAYDGVTAVVRSALEEGVAAEALDESLSGVSAADLVILALPVDRSLDALERLAPHLAPAAVVTDVGSTKRAIAMTAGDLGLGSRFVGSHPLTGDHRSGWASSRTGLYHGATVFLCPTNDAEPAAIDRVRTFWEALGARCRSEPPDAHDERMAWVSHLPQVVATSTAATIADSGFSPADLGPGGRDATRLAGSSPEMWSAIALANREPLGRAVLALEHKLRTLRLLLESDDEVSVEHFFRRGRDWLV